MERAWARSRKVMVGKALRRGVLVLLGAAAMGFAARAAAQGINTETIEYEDNLSKWVVGQVKRTTTNDIETARTGFDSTYAVPTTTHTFGKPQQTLTYDTASAASTGQRGTLKTVADGRGNVTTLTQWKRGIPGKVTYPATTDQPTAVSQSAVINDDGTIAQVTDENGFVTKYDYDPMGRLSLIDYPDADTVNWVNTDLSFTKSTVASRGLPAGHWVQIVGTGNGRKVVYYDALWRPVIESSYIAGDGTSYSFVVKRYDAGGRLAFQSYPLDSLSNYADTTLKGAKYVYDALDRTRSASQDSELGALTTTTSYLNNADGYYTLVTNPNGGQTRTWFQAFDEPSYDRPREIWQPEGVYTDIARDVFGKPISIKRRNSGDTLSSIRTYTYFPVGQELCRTVEPETGATLMGYDGAGNLTWSASGLPVATACDIEGDTATILARRAVRTYDARNRLKTLSFPDGNGNQTWTYTPDSLPASVVANNVGGQQATTTYAYDRRRLLEAETLSYGSVFSWPVDYVYNTNGHLAAQVWHGLNVDYLPDALGRPTKAGAFASGVSYHPNGALKQFTYGNGVVHTLTQNVRQLPDTSKDAFGTTAYLSDAYDYDANGNVAAITDGATGRNQRGNRTMGYDALDRLTSTTSPMFGTATYTYDVLDNLTRAGLTGGSYVRSHYYCYDVYDTTPTHRLDFIRTGATCTGSTPSPAVRALEYDVQGNLSERDSVSYRFDYGNRLRTASLGNSRYAYDGLGRRVWDATTDDKYSHYLQNGQLSMTADERAKEVAEYIYLQGSLVAIRERNTATNVYTTKYQHTDALGSPVLVTGPNRGVDARTEYEPYGRVTSPALPQDGPGYTGHVYDAATGLVQMQQRYYDPIIGRMLSVDPVTAYSSGDWRHFNVYAYAFNNPYRFTDPDGRQSLPKMFMPTNPQAVQAQAVARSATKQAEARSMDGVKAVGQSLAEGRGTLQVGVVVNGAVGPAAATAGAGVAVDGQGNVAGYAEYGAGVGPSTVASAVAGVSVSATNANTVNDLAGPSENLSVGGGDGVGASADMGVFKSGDNPFTSVGVTVGAGAGAGGATTTTNTQIVPIVENKKP